MALFNRPILKNRGMPTLSLQVKPSAKARGGTPLIVRWAWGNVCVPLFLFTFVLSQLITTPLFAQDLKNRTEEMYPFGTIIIASEPLPDKVYGAQKNKIMVSVMFIEKGTTNVFINSVGTGFVSDKPGIILTARHLLELSLINAQEQKNERIKTNPKFDFEYIFMGTIVTDKEWIKFPLSLSAIGEKGTLKDVMALSPDNKTMELARMVGDSFNPNPYNVLMRTSKFADAKIGEKVYISGFAPSTAVYIGKDNKPVPVYLGLINHTFVAEVDMLLPEMPGQKTGVQTIYQLRNHAEPGFSGGKVMNKEGETIGMTIAISHEKNFIYTISSKDIQDFLKENKLK